MNLATLDLEGVLVPEIWIAFADAAGIPELRRTTRDEPDYDKLMRYRLGILAEKGVKLADIKRVIYRLAKIQNAHCDTVGYFRAVCVSADGKAWLSDSLLPRT